MSIDLRTESILGLTELLDERRLLERCSLGLEIWRPLCLPKQFRMSVRLMTPVKRPEMGVCCKDEAVTAGKEAPIAGDATGELGSMGTAGVVSGVEGVEDEGEAASTIHSRCALVATTFATTCESDWLVFT